MKYAFYNGGTIFFFKPQRIVFDIRDGSSKTYLDFHKELVAEFNRKDVFITDGKGKLVQ